LKDARKKLAWPTPLSQRRACWRAAGHLLLDGVQLIGGSMGAVVGEKVTRAIEPPSRKEFRS